MAPILHPNDQRSPPGCGAVAPPKHGDHPLLGRQRINLTFRKVS
jgi:hypothetical protein